MPRPPVPSLVIPSHISELVRLHLVLRSTVYVQYNAEGVAFMVNVASLEPWVYHETTHHRAAA